MSLHSTTVDTVHTTMDSPCGLLTLVARDGYLAGVYMTGQRHRPPEESFGPRADLPLFDQAIEELTAYFAGERTTFGVELRPQGTPFQLQVWDALRRIPYGKTVTYGELAEAMGRPTASRAVGLANGRNPISVIVPCHRVIGADGSLTGYGGGLARKQWLLDFERGTGQQTLI
jgi:methylated-DNA-[protein]-cysteine S-methyltransferase